MWCRISRQRANANVCRPAIQPALHASCRLKQALRSGFLRRGRKRCEDEDLQVDELAQRDEKRGHRVHLPPHTRQRDVHNDRHDQNQYVTGDHDKRPGYHVTLMSIIGARSFSTA